jgi:hypothetical protein
MRTPVRPVVERSHEMKKFIAYQSCPPVPLPDLVESALVVVIAAVAQVGGRHGDEERLALHQQAQPLVRCPPRRPPR